MKRKETIIKKIQDMSDLSNVSEDEADEHRGFVMALEWVVFGGREVRQ